MSFHKLQSDPSEREQGVLAFWAENRVFERTLEHTRGRPTFVFFEGPPTANGRPHFGHLLPRVYKDVFPRYKTMRGFHVGRKAGWDCHGLPVELEVERRLGLDSKQDIEVFGLEAFIDACKASVRGYISDWERMIRRMGLWIDLDHPYVTYEDAYIETLWWELKAIHKQGLLYQGHKILPYCSRCGTGLSSHEVAQGYRLAEDPSVVVKLRLADGHGALLVWTTTPWTLPANVAAAVAPDADYAEVDFEGERLILALDRLEPVLGREIKPLRVHKGKELVGLYSPLYPLSQEKGAYRIVEAGFVSMDEGTGIVHIAPAFGEEDHELGRAAGLPHLQPVDLEGRFSEEFALAGGVFVKEADPIILADLRARGLVLTSGTVVHEYPFCWRCDSPLLYYAMDSWFIATTQVKEALIAANAEANWYPEHVGRGRFGDFLESLRDWALSRDRYWGTPLPVWTCSVCGQELVVGSRAELVERALDPASARSVELHRPFVDRIELRCRCGGTMRRVPYVLDTWFDSGSMHTAQWHYPFEGEREFREAFPADFICEALDQTRGWFYTLLATSVLLHNAGCYRNVLVTGMGLDAQGQKMSKSRGNVMDPMPIADRHGADAIRWYVAAESAPWSERRMSEEGVASARYGLLDTVRNCHDFLVLYAGIDGFVPSPEGTEPPASSVLDRWMDSRTSAAVAAVAAALDGFKVVEACREIERYVDDLSNWYIRLSRSRFWAQGYDQDKRAAYRTLYVSLRTLAQLMAPFTPFLSEALWRSLRQETDPGSVHLCAWPAAADRDLGLEKGMARIREVVSLGLAARNVAQVKVRQPLPALHVALLQEDDGIPDELWMLACAELNVRRIERCTSLDGLRTPQLTLDFSAAGPRLGSRVQRAARALAAEKHDLLWGDLAASGRAVVRADGEEIALAVHEVKVLWKPVEGFVFSGEGERAVALDTRVDRELLAEGRVRELVHRVQLARKEAGFEVTDRIEIGWEGELGEVFMQHAERIARDVLAERIAMGPLERADHVSQIEADGLKGRLTLRRAGAAG